MAQGIVAQVSGTTLWRWLSADALRPWRHRSWIFPRDPDFAGKAGRILDLYARIWQGKPLQSSEFVISADEKTSIQARRRKQPTLPVAVGRPMRVEHEYFRQGAWTYLAAWDVHRAKVFRHCEKKNGIAPTDRLIADVMRREPYKSAQRGFLDHGQLLGSSRSESCRTHSSPLAQCLSRPHPCSCQLDQSNRDLFLHRSKKSAIPKRFFLAFPPGGLSHGFSKAL